MVWGSVRAGGDTKTRKSRRTLALPRRCVDALRSQWFRQAAARRLVGARWHDHDLVFASEVGTQLGAANVRRAFRKIATMAGLPAQDWTPRELRDTQRPQQRRMAWLEALDRASDQAVCVVGVTGFEPATSSSRTKRATKLRHTPMACRLLGGREEV